MSVPQLDLKAQYRLIRSEIEEAIQRVLASQQFVLGPEVEAFEQEIADYCGCREAIGVSSGTDALLVGLMALGVGPGDEVITAGYSFFATAGCISRLGARPVFVDIDPKTFNIRPEAVKEAITERSKALVPVHLYGQMAQMEELMEIAGLHGLYVIEDAAQAIGARYRNKRAGSIGHIGCFSFYPTKNLGGIGDGGLVTTDDSELARKLRMLRNHGYRDRYHSSLIGGNFRLDAIQAAVLRAKFRYLEKWNRARRRCAARYRKLFERSGLVASRKPDCFEFGCSEPGLCLKGNGPPLLLPEELPESQPVYHQFVIRVRSRDQLLQHLRNRRLGAEIYYPVPLHLQECFADLNYRDGDLPASECAAQSSLALPIYPELADESQREIVDSIRQFYD